MRKLLWIGDAIVSTGFARATHHTLEVLRKTWDVSVLGINYLGDPHSWPYPIYPAWPGGDVFGLKRVKELVDKIQPDLVVVQNDPWNVREYFKLVEGKAPVVATMPVDGKNCRGSELNGIALSIFWTQFGLNEARYGGYQGPAAVIPLGVDTELYKPMDRLEARNTIGLPGLEDVWIVGNVNRNQPRKRLDLTIRAFCEWVKDYHHDDAYLFLHVSPTGDRGYDVKQVMKYYGFSTEKKRLILVEPNIGIGLDEKAMPAVYSCFNVQVSTTQGEGWGLTTMEGMACGIPQIVPDWAALGEWCEDAVVKIPCSSTIMTPDMINAMGGVVNNEKFVEALENVKKSKSLRDVLTRRGLDLVNRPEFRWESIGQKFADALEDPYAESRVGKL